MVKALKVKKKQDARTGMNLCVLLRCTTKSMYKLLMIQVVVVVEHSQFIHLKKHLSHLVRLSTLLIIFFNALKTITIK